MCALLNSSQFRKWTDYLQGFCLFFRVISTRDPEHLLHRLGSFSHHFGSGGQLLVKSLLVFVVVFLFLVLQACSLTELDEKICAVKAALLKRMTEFGPRYRTDCPLWWTSQDLHTQTTDPNSVNVFNRCLFSDLANSPAVLLLKTGRF